MSDSEQGLAQILTRSGEPARRMVYPGLDRPSQLCRMMKPEFCITHAPGYMLVTDLVNSRLAAF